MRRLIALDFESYSAANLPKTGLAVYVSDPNFKVLLAAVTMLADEDGYRSEDINTLHSHVLDFTEEPEQMREALANMLAGSFIVAHNAAFEMAVLTRIGIDVPSNTFIDSAVIASVLGVGRSLEAAAPQALDVDKMASGKDGIQLFCIPGTYQMENGNDEFDRRVVEDHPEEWEKFKEYCALDAALSLQLALAASPALDENETFYSALTLEMNSVGWHVDVPMVQEMNRRFKENLNAEIQRFQEENDAHDLNLSSHPQLMKWCKERGILASSFDEKTVEKLIDKIGRRLELLPEDDKKVKPYTEVLHMLRTKQVMGGSSLKKLDVIEAQVCEGRLFDSYLHAGASTTLRTTGRGVQMQNLPRLSGGRDVGELFNPESHWTNDELAHSLRKVFTATTPQGRLIVGDYRAVESRGLAWYAGEQWKLDTYRKGLGVYEMQAAKFFDTQYERVSEQQRKFGKAGELSCGYGAGPEAVEGFTEKMGMPISLGEATKLVHDFRTANPETVKFWQALQDALNEVLDVGMSQVAIPHGTIDFLASESIDSLVEQTGNKDLKTLVIKVSIPGADDPMVFRRMFHGLYREGNSIQFWKPSARKTGDLWTPVYTDPKTKAKRKHSLYGGKIAGILTQSLCRELFMDGLGKMFMWQLMHTNVHLVGQFHDEMVADWNPGKPNEPTLEETENTMRRIMSTSPIPGFPLDAEVHSAYRYEK